VKPSNFFLILLCAVGVWECGDVYLKQQIACVNAAPPTAAGKIQADACRARVRASFQDASLSDAGAKPVEAGKSGAPHGG
jgi:hypothetical protein